MAENDISGESLALWRPGEANEKQKLFYASRCLYTAYGGAKGGGKTHAVRIKAIGGALSYPGIRILIMRKTYIELEENHIRPIVAQLPTEMAVYNGSSHILKFFNGSGIRFGHWGGQQSEQEYNGQEYDWIFIDEATQFTERAFNFLGGCLRGVNSFPKRMYLTCNPGGVGHNWVKRLFIDRSFRTDCENPEENECPSDYCFIPATVEDNKQLLKSSPGYLKALSAMPEELKRAYRYGDWDAVGGNYFKEFSMKTHGFKPFLIPENWYRYRSFDYGLDMLAVGWFAVDSDGRSWCYREFCRSGLIVSSAAGEILSHTLPEENIVTTFAPPDMWSRQKDSGRSMAEIFTQSGVELSRADNSRAQGHMILKNTLLPIPLHDPFAISLFPPGEAPKALPGLMFFEGLKRIPEDLKDIQSDADDPNDCAAEPHELSHTVDMLRYYAVSRKLQARAINEYIPDFEQEKDYDDYMQSSLLCAAEREEDSYFYS